MARPTRAFRPRASELEGRMLLTAQPDAALSPPMPPVAEPGSALATPMSTISIRTSTARSIPRGESVYFAGPSMSGQPQYALQDDGPVPVYLGWSLPPHPRGQRPYQVMVQTDPSSPAVGVNVGAVQKVFTIGGGDSDNIVTVPILAGAPNPGVVDVTLTLTPLDPPPGLEVGPPLHLKVLASKEFLPPYMSGPRVTKRGIDVRFSKPMDPAGASNPNNYAVTLLGSPGTGPSCGYSCMANPVKLFGSLFSKGTPPRPPMPVRITSAQYDLATLTTTLVPRRRIRPGMAMLTVREGPRQAPGGRGPAANPGPPLTDLLGQRLGGFSAPMLRTS